MRLKRPVGKEKIHTYPDTNDKDPVFYLEKSQLFSFYFHRDVLVGGGREKNAGINAKLDTRFGAFHEWLQSVSYRLINYLVRRN